MGHTVADRAGAGGDLGDHPAGQGAIGHHLVELVGGGRGHQAPGIGQVAEDADHVGHVHQLLGADGLGHRAGRRVGVDVVGLPLEVGADCGDDGDQLFDEQLLEDAGVDGLDVAHVAQVGVAGGGGDQAGVLARQADGQRPVDVDGADDVAVDLAHEHHAGDLERLGIGDPQALAELRLHAEPLHQQPDLRPAAVHDHGSHPHRAHEDDVLGEER